MKNVSEAKFTGVIAFKNGNAALQMQLLVNTIIDKSVNIFSSKRTFAPSQLIDDLDKMLKLSENFVEYASNEENAKLERQILKEMGNHVDKLREVVRNFNGKNWTLSQSQIIAETMKEVFQRLEKLTEKNEEDHVRKALKQTGTAKSCQSSLANGTDYDSSNWQILLKNYTTMQNILFSMMENRASVTKDEKKKKEILDLQRRIKIISDKLPDMCEEARSTNFPLNLMERIEETGHQLIEHTEQFEEILMFGIECFSSFQHTPIEPEKFGEQLDDLVNAIQSGNSQGFMSAARNLTSEVGNIKNRELLDNETKLLNEQTKQLLINAREVLKDNDKENAKKKMNDLAAILKKNVQDLALQEKQMMNSKKKLSKQATGLGLAMQNMGQVLTNITGNEMVSNSPLFKSKSEKEFEEIEKNLGELEFEKEPPKNSPSFGPKKTSTSSPFTNTKNTRSPPFIPKSSDLDDLEKDLQEIEITPLKNPQRTSGHFYNDNNQIINVNTGYSRNSRGSRGSRRSRNSGNELEELEDLEKELDEMNSAPKRKSYTYATSRTTIEPRKSTFTTIQEESTSIDELEMLERELEDL